MCKALSNCVGFGTRFSRLPRYAFKWRISFLDSFGFQPKGNSGTSSSGSAINLRSFSRVQLCPGVHSVHSLMDTRVGPIEHSQMDPTEGRSTKRTTGCVLTHILQPCPAFRGFCGVANRKPWAMVKLYIVQPIALYIVHPIAHSRHCKWQRRRRNPTEAGRQGNWDEEAMEKR